MSTLYLFALTVLLSVTTITTYAQVDTQGTTYESSNCRIQSLIDSNGKYYAEDTLTRSECLVIQGLSILASNSYIKGQFVRHEDHVNTSDNGIVEFVDPATGNSEKCEYSVHKGQKIAHLILIWLNNEIQPERDGIHSLQEAIEKVRSDVLKSVFINCGIS